jgi:hypothetical protein
LCLGWDLNLYPLVFQKPNAALSDATNPGWVSVSN